MNDKNIKVITDKKELYDKCENMEQLFDKYYLPLLDIHYRKTYQLQSNWNSLREWFKYGIEEYSTDDGFIQNILKQGLDKMNELEGKDKNE